MLDNTVSDYYAGITDNGNVVFIDYLRKDLWRAKIVSGQYELLNNDGCTNISNDFNLKYVRPILIDELLNMKILYTKIQWCEKEAKSIRLRETKLNYLIRGFSEGQGVNYCIKLDASFKFTVYYEASEKNILFTSDTFEEAKSWCEQYVLEGLGFKS